MKCVFFFTFILASCIGAQASESYDYIIPEPYLNSFSTALSGNVCNRIDALIGKDLSQITISDDKEIDRKNKQILRQAIVLLEYYPDLIPNFSKKPDLYCFCRLRIEFSEIMANLYNQLGTINSMDILRQRTLESYKTFIEAYSIAQIRY